MEFTSGSATVAMDQCCGHLLLLTWRTTNPRIALHRLSGGNHSAGAGGPCWAERHGSNKLQGVFYQPLLRIPLTDIRFPAMAYLSSGMTSFFIRIFHCDGAHRYSAMRRPHSP